MLSNEGFLLSKRKVYYGTQSVTMKLTFHENILIGQETSGHECPLSALTMTSTRLASWAQLLEAWLALTNV